MNPPILPTRRAVLAAAAVMPFVGLSALGAEVDARSSDPWRGLKVGVASYSFRKVPLDVTIQGIQRLALKYVSIKDVHLKLDSTTQERKEVAGKFREAGITPISCGVISLKNDEREVRRAFEYARDIEVPTIVCAPEPDALPLLDKFVKEFGLKIAIHNHGPEAKHFKSPTETWQAIQSHDPHIGLCIDVGHTARAGEDPAEAIRKYKARLYDVHFKDISDPHGKGASVEVEVGRGVLNIKAMLQALLDIRFAGHVGFEHERTAESPLPGLAESVGYTKGVLSTLTTSPAPE